MPEQGFNIAATMRHVQNQHVVVLNAVNDDVFAHRKSSQTRAQVLVAAASEIGVAGKKKKTFGDRINYAVGDLNVAAFLGYVIPDVVQLRFDLRLPDGAPSARRFSLSGKAGSSALLHFTGKIPHGLLCGDAASFTARQGIFRHVHRGENFRTRALTFFPQRQRFLYRILDTVKPASLDGPADKRFLIGGQTYFHSPKGKRQESKVSSSHPEPRTRQLKPV